MGNSTAVRVRTLFVVVALGTSAFACDQSAQSGTEFILRGRVTAVRPGAEPPQNFKIDFDPDDQDERSEGEPDDSGAMQVRVEQGTENVGDCNLRQTNVVVYWTVQTDFAPTDAASDGNFPANLNGAQVDIDGRAFTAGDDESDDCAFVADAVQLEGARGTGSPAPDDEPAEGSPGPTESPLESPAPTATGAVVTPTP